MDAAADAGCDAVKFQVFRAGTLNAVGAGASDYLAAAGIKQDVAELIAGLEMPYEMLAALAAHARERGLRFMAAAFSVADARAVDPHVSVHKLASYEINHIRLLEFIAATGKPVVMSTGGATRDDIRRALDFFRARSAAPVALMQCVAAYPAPPAACNLRALPALAAEFDCVVGLSDHTFDAVAAPAAAVALGARVIEKHFTLSRTLPGPDHSFAVEPDGLAALVRTVRLVEEMLGSGAKAVQPAEEELVAYAFRGVQATRDVSPGEPLREGVNMDILRPGKNRRGMNPLDIARLEGRPAARAIGAGDGIREEDAA